MQILQNITRPQKRHRQSIRYQSPREVLDDHLLDSLQKRAILSSWASDLFAVESSPWLRRIPGVQGSQRLGDILAALRALDDEDNPPPPGGASQHPVRAALTSVRAVTRSCAS